MSKRWRPKRSWLSSPPTQKDTRSKEDIARIKKIMSVPVNIKSTQAYYMLRANKHRQEEVGPR